MSQVAEEVFVVRRMWAAANWISVVKGILSGNVWRGWAGYSGLMIYVTSEAGGGVARRRMARTMPGGRIRAEALARGPNGLALCRWCDLEILAKRRRTFCSDYCVDQWRLRTDPGYVRERVFARDRGVCAGCGADTVAIFAALKRARGKERAAGLRFYGMKTISSRRSLWDADHVVPVAEGGGQCDLDNLRTLCVACHREATAALRARISGRQKTKYANLVPANAPE
jgi:5-methylcytosine-specific restriction enzyme A